MLLRSKLTAAATAVALIWTGAATAEARGLSATIRYTEYGIPHVVATDYRQLGFGQGYAAATDNACSLAQTMLTTSGTRSRYLGADANPGSGLSRARTNLASDLYFQGINDTGVVERLVARKDKLGPSTEVREAVAGYAAGVSENLARTNDPACKGAAWLRPMTEIDVYRHMYALGMVFGQGSAADGLATQDPELSIGSNAIALGSERTVNGRGMSLANPHLPWNTPDLRLWQSHLTIPGRLDVAGAGIVGVPFLWLGHNSTMAWSGTAADTTRTFSLFALKLVPGSPTRYLVDGKAEDMVRRDVTVTVQDGTTVTRPQWWSRYGPVVTAANGQNLPWTAETAYSLADANADNLRFANSMERLSRAGDTASAFRALEDTQGLPWMNIFITDSRGKARYSQLHNVPNVTDERAASCNTELGKQTWAADGLAVLDGSRGDCAWGRDGDAVQPGVFGPSKLPSLQRDDFLENSNDSYWLTNPARPVTGFSRIFGTTGTERTARTRGALTDLAKGVKYTRQSLQDLMFSNHDFVADLAVDDTVRLCRTMSADLAEACEALSTWDRNHDVDSRGALLFDRFWAKARNAAGGALWKVPFSAADPIGTPNTLNTDLPAIGAALTAAVGELRAAGIPMNAPLGDNQYVVRNGERIPIDGGTAGLGVFNSIRGPWDPAKGYTEMQHGATYLHVVSFDGDGCPDASTLLAYSQSSDSTSSHFSDQTKLYSKKQWVTERFCERDVLASPELKVVQVRQRL
ncbi:MAG TPA: penicillin acylase family protein [Umezawaea sp.]|nr:penicillin acylase family protein [Umezawaea sp.]